MTIRKSVLVAEDEEHLRAALKLSLQGSYDVTDVADGRQGIEALTATEFSVIVTDVVMPDADGIQLLLAAKERRPQAAVILMTAYGDRVSPEEAERIGAFGYLVKPFDVDELRSMIDCAAGLRAATCEPHDAASESCRTDLVVSPEIPVAPGSIPDSGAPLAIEASYVEAALAATSWNLDEAAEALGMPLPDLIDKIRAYNLRPPG
ncbi:MAG: response regulator [Acidobacteriota bacterium]